ncbi:MAG: hypothetical protein K940chlam2_01298 [Chlamydiae bacterium]|nr:hypothetical protein [Chlamydiota bacterium]
MNNNNSIAVTALSTGVVVLPLGGAHLTHNDPFREFDGIMNGRPRSSQLTRDRLAGSIGLRTVDSGGGRVALERQDANSQVLKDHYLTVRELIVGAKAPALLDTVDDFFINFSMETAEFTGANGERVVIDLLNLKNPAMKAYVDAYLDLADETLSTRKHRPFTISAQSKGNASKGAPRPFQRGTPALDALPKSFAVASQSLLPQLLQGISDPQMRRTVVKRVMRAEFIQRRALQDLDVEITRVEAIHRHDLTRQLTDPAARKAVNSSDRHLVALRELQKEIASVDAAALAIGFAHFPNDPYFYQDAREDAATRAREFTDNFLKVDDDTRTDDAAVAAEKGYGEDVGGLPHQERVRYKEHTQSRGTAFKKEGFEDVLFRSVIDFERQEMLGKALGYDPVYLYKNDFASPIHGTFVKDMMVEIHNQMANQVVLPARNGFDNLRSHSPGAKDKDNEAVDAANLERIRADLESLRKATSYDAPPPADDDDSEDGRI